MTAKENLIACLNDFTSRQCKEIHLIWTDGRKGGIGNPKAIKVAMDALINELKRQINECN